MMRHSQYWLQPDAFNGFKASVRSLPHLFGPGSNICRIRQYASLHDYRYYRVKKRPTWIRTSKLSFHAVKCECAHGLLDGLTNLGPRWQSNTLLSRAVPSLLCILCRSAFRRGTAVLRPKRSTSWLRRKLYSCWKMCFSNLTFLFFLAYDTL